MITLARWPVKKKTDFDKSVFFLFFFKFFGWLKICSDVHVIMYMFVTRPKVQFFVLQISKYSIF